MQEHGISVRSLYTEIDGSQLDELIRETRTANPTCGSKMLVAYHGERDIFVPTHRIREALSRVDPLAVAARQ